MYRRMAFLVVAGLALAVATGGYAADQFEEDLVLNGDLMAELPVGTVVESSEPSFIEDEGYLAAIDAAAAAEWAMYESTPEVIAEFESHPEVTIAEFESPAETTVTEAESSDMDLSALAMEPVDFQPTPSSDQTLDLRAFLEEREAEIQAA